MGEEVVPVLHIAHAARAIACTGGSDSSVVSREFGIPVDEEGLAGRECDLVDPDGNRLRVATRRG
jgi:hypothetical protein